MSGYYRKLFTKEEEFISQPNDDWLIVIWILDKKLKKLCSLWSLENNVRNLTVRIPSIRIQTISLHRFFKNLF